MDEVVLDEKTYIGSKKAAQECGYTQDYVGQLARSGQIDAKRVSGQWYVFLESLRQYKTKAETFKPEPPKYQPDPSVEATLNIDGKEYVSAARAAKLTEYNQDYVGQLARAGKIPSKQIGNRWYIERVALLEHKKEKDAMLRAVQAESVGLKRPEPKILSTPVSAFSAPKPLQPLLSYSTEMRQPLFPEINEQMELKAKRVEVKDEPLPIVSAPSSRIPIRVIKPLEMELKEEPKELKLLAERTVSLPGKPIFRGLFMPALFSVVLLIAIALGTYKRDLVYSYITGSMNSVQTASVDESVQGIHGIIERILTKELVYTRK
jgi:hypothetical protein